MTCPWYPPATYEPAAGTGQLLANPPFAPMPDPDLIETACHNAVQAMHRESERAHREQVMAQPDALTCWLLKGERGPSSDAMVAHIMGLGGTADHPYNPANLRRCRLLVEQVPVIEACLPNMATCSPTWARIVAHWDELCSLMDGEAPDWRSGKGLSPKTHALLKRLREESK